MIVIEGIVFDNGNSASPRELNCSHPRRASFEDLRVRTLFRTIARAVDLEAKSARMKTEGVAAFVDPDGYRRLHAQKREAFDALVKAEQ